MIDERELSMEKLVLSGHKEHAEELGITLQEYLSLKILEKLDDLSVRAYVVED